jgi:hypothetical protein
MLCFTSFRSVQTQQVNAAARGETRGCHYSRTRMAASLNWRRLFHHRPNFSPRATPDFSAKKFGLWERYILMQALSPPKSKLREGIPDGAADVHQGWKNGTALWTGKRVIRGIGRNGMRTEKLKQIRRADATGDAFDHDPLDAAIASKQKNCGDGNPASLFGIIETPGTDHFSLRIAQNRKR